MIKATAIGIRRVLLTAATAFGAAVGGLATAGDLDIGQDGQGGGIDGRVLDEGIAFTIDIDQAGIENTLAFVLQSDLTATILQEGNFGAIDLDLRSEGDGLSITQRGANNKIDGILSGSTNTSTVLQESDGNVLEFDISGSLNVLDVAQTGSGNTMDLDLKGSEGSFKLSQSGNDNSLDLNQIGAGISLTIDQAGSGESISIYQ